MNSPAARQSAARPAAVTVIGWCAVVLGVLTILSGVMGLFVAGVLPALEEVPVDISIAFPPWLFEHWTDLSIAQIVLAVVVVIAGVGFLQLRPWARTAIEVLTWLSGLATLAFCWFWVQLARSLAAQLPDDPSFPFSAGLFITVGVVVVAVCIVPLVVTIRVLRAPAIRAAMTRT